MIELEGFEVGSGATAAEMLAGGSFTVVITYLEMEGAPAFDVGNDDVEDLLNF